MADFPQSPYAGIDYYKAGVARMGQSPADAFLRPYVTRGADRMGMGRTSAVDMVGRIADTNDLRQQSPRPSVSFPTRDHHHDSFPETGYSAADRLPDAAEM
jgi:hypothetical protein